MTGGETIKEMQNSTGCKINVSPPSGPDIERSIGLIGTRDAIEHAKRVIMDKVQAVVSSNDAIKTCTEADLFPGRQKPPWRRES